MVIRIEVSDAILSKERLNLHLEKKELSTLEEVKAGNRMLADSNKLAFIYLIENTDSFIYISIGYKYWEELKQAYEHRLPVHVCEHGKPVLTLTGFHEELDYLLENIKDNSNYGYEMVDAVAAKFH